MSFLINPYILGSTCSGNAISTLNLGYYFKMDGNGLDSSGNAHHASVETALSYSAASKSTNFGSAVEFNGSTSRMQAPNSADFKGSGGTLSVFCWVYIHDYDIATPTAIANEYVPTTAGWSLSPRSTDILISWQATSNIGRGTGVPTNTWTHIGFTYDNANVRIYQNGVQVGTNFASAGADLNSPTTLKIGTDYVGNLGWDGLIDEVAIWNRTLSAAEISTLYNSTCPLKA